MAFFPDFMPARRISFGFGGGPRSERKPTLIAKRRPDMIESRASQVGRLLFVLTGGQVRRTEVKYEDLANEGYKANPVIYRCIKKIADAIASMPVLIFNGEEDVTAEHELSLTLARPNPSQIWEELVAELVGHLHLAGECFLEGVTLSRSGGALAELYALRPDRVKIEPAADGSIAAFIYDSGSGELKFPTAKPERFQPILHWKFWNPTDHWRGLAPMMAAAAAGDEHNDAVAHAKALYKNAARPSGALVYAPPNGAPASLTDEQFSKLQSQIQEDYSGVDNAGRPLLLDGGLKWEQMGFSPRDMESSEGRSAAARDIALALGVPPLMLGIKGDNTFANYAEARLAFWDETVWPIAKALSKKLTAWVAPLYGPDFRIELDVEGSPIAEAAKADRWERVKSASFLTVDEQRAELGFEPLKNGEGQHVMVAASLATLADVIEGGTQGDDYVDPNATPARGETSP